MKLPLHFNGGAPGAKYALAAMLCLGVLPGCRSEPKAQPLASPGVTTASEVFRGSPLAVDPFGSGPSTASEDDAGSGAPMAAGAVPIVAQAHWYLAKPALLASEIAASMSLASRATLVISADKERPWQATPRALSGVRLITGEPATSVVQKLASAPNTSAVLLGQTNAGLREGLSAGFRLVQDPMNGEATAPSHSAKSAYLTLHPEGDQASSRLKFAVAAEDAGAVRELVIAEWPEDRPGLPVVVVFPPESGEAGNRILTLSVRDASVDGEDAELLAGTDAALAGTSADGTSSAVALSSLSVAFEGATAALGNPESRRAALAFLARETDASLAEELALMANDSVLDALVQRLVQRWETAVPAPGKLGFELEREALGSLAELDDAGNLPAEMRTLLTVHAGEAGRRAASLQEALQGAGSLVELHSILAAENAIYLEDSEAAARVRAFEWLSARGLAPAGYDPLSSRESRRAALDAAMAAPEPQPQSRPTGGAT